MTTNHSLTDKIISNQFGRYDGIDDVMVYDEHDIRAAYDAGCHAGRAQRLEQVLNWLEACDSYDLESHFDHTRMINDLRKAMRPQEDNND